MHGGVTKNIFCKALLSG